MASSSSSSSGVVCRVQMWLDSRSDLTSVMESLSDRSIQFLDLYLRSSFLSGFAPERIREVMKTIGNLPQLERLDISCPYSSEPITQDDNPQTYLPVSAIQLALTSKLTHLLIVNVKLSGSHGDFQAFAKATQTLKRLHCVVLAEVRLQKEQSDSIESSSNSRMDPFLQSLCKMPSLGHVLISGSEDLGVLQASTLKLCGNNLRDLCLSQLSLTTPHLRALAENPLTNLRELDLQCHLTVDGARALAQLLHHNSTLEELTLRLTSCPQTFSATPRTPAARAVEILNRRAAAREELRNLIFFDFHESDSDDSDDDDEYDESSLGGETVEPEPGPELQQYQVLAAAIVQCRRLTSFELESANFSTPSLLEPFRQMLRDNYSLESVRLHCGEQKTYFLEDEIAFYTRLNHLGRGHLFQCPHCSHCDASYLNMLDALKNDTDLSAFYYFCRAKPSLLMRGGPPSKACEKKASPPRVLGKRKRLYRAVKYNGQSYKN